MNSRSTNNSNKDNEELSIQMNRGPMLIKRSQGIKGMLRDVLGCVFMIISSFLVYTFDGNEISKYIDPAFAIVSAICLFALSFSYSK